LLVLDSGKSLFKGNNNNKQIPLIQARGIAKAYILMGYDAIALSASDVMNGDLFLKETLNDGFPWISANVVDNNGQPITRPYILKTINSIKIAIIGLTDTLLVAGQYSTIDYTSPLTTLLNQLTAESDMIILLSNLQANVNQEIAKQFPEIDIIFSSDRSLGKMAPKVVNNTLITQTSSRGKYLGKLDVEWNNGNTWYNDRLLPLSELTKRRAIIEFQLRQLENNTDTSNKKKVSRLQLQQQRLEKEIENRTAQEEENAGHPYNKHRLRFVPVQPTHSPISIESIVENIDKTIKEQATTN
jgi:2',3'-cyclic-nucleotide 2'-phosphodiesterase (5'-nucleotidase family)